MLGSQNISRNFATLSASINSFRGATVAGSIAGEKRTQPKSLLRHQQFRFISKKRSHTLKIGENREISYRLMPGQSEPTIVMVPGFHSYAHMNGLTAKSLLRYCDIHDYSCIVYDHEGMGESALLEGTDRTKVLFSHWVEDAVAVVEELADGPIVFASCSLGGWLSIVAAQQLKHRLHGMVLYAPALNYVYPYYERHISRLPSSIKERLDAGFVHNLSHTSYGDAMLKKDFAEDSLQHELDLSKPLDFTCPIRILHGLDDKEVNPDQSLQLSKIIKSGDVDLIYRKSARHQLTEPPDIELFLNTLDRLLKDCPVRDDSGFNARDKP